MEKIAIAFVLTKLIFGIPAKLLTHQIINRDVLMKVNQEMTKQDAEKYC